MVMEDIIRTGTVCSHLGQQVIAGNAEVIRYIYGHIWGESPPLIRLISQLQDCITARVIEGDTEGIYSDDFLYYWAMINLGEQSPLICKNLAIARACFRKIKKTFPLVVARLAYIELQMSTEPAMDEQNVDRLDVLRQWASKQDLFSMIALAKICFCRFLEEQNDEVNTICLELPHQAIHLLQAPCDKGHPVAIRLWNDIFTYTENFGGMIDESRINSYYLYDIKDTCKYANTPGYVLARVIYN